MKHEGIGGVTRFVIMNNWFNTPFNPNELYDLKGSTVGRTTLEAKKGSILKDLDIKRKLYLPPYIKKKFLEQLESDSKFLSSHNVMDYSLLLGISYNDDDSDITLSTKNKKDSFISVFHESDGGTIGYNYEEQRQEIYFFGIIDILQRYTGRKKLEHLFKSMAYSSYRISIVQPSYYAKRFLKFLTSLLSEEEADAKKKKKEKKKKTESIGHESSVDESEEASKKKNDKKKKTTEESEIASDEKKSKSRSSDDEESNDHKK